MRPKTSVLLAAEAGWEWARTIGRAVVGDVTASPFVQTATGKTFEVRLKNPLPYELDGGDRAKTKTLSLQVVPDAITVCVPGEGDA